MNSDEIYYNKNVILESFNNGDLLIWKRDTGVNIELSAEEAVDLATKIINYCYPYTISRSINDRQKQSNLFDSGPKHNE